ncbi:MAG: thiamine biosynthesis protein ThiC [Methanosaeta sp. PtaU1.Bin055]|nr:MAG: thiamine biosynthesis protein ThiC [Methanosaeta sp. PtaU1.Bin055]
MEFEILQVYGENMSMDETILEAAAVGREVPAVLEVAEAEGLSPVLLLKQVSSGRVVIMQRDERPPLGIGEGLKTKVNANVGTSADLPHPDVEVEKAKVAERYGADTVTDLSMGGPVDDILRRIWEETTRPLTTVPIYQTVAQRGSFESMTEDDLLSTIRRHVAAGVSSIVVHAAITFEMLTELAKTKRIMGIVSKGGSFTSAWMLKTGEENPFLSNFEAICEILARKDVVLSLGNTMRSGCIHDPMDGLQWRELDMNADLARRANELGVQVIIEGMGGHVRPDRIPEYVAHYKEKTGYRPLFVAGPLPIDIGVGYDHISGSVGGALAAGAGADYLCYITPSEHLALPNAAQVREGVVAFRIAAHIGDTLKYGPRPQDEMLARHRRVRDWEKQFKLAIDGERARETFHRDGTGTCSMCGKYCAIAVMEDLLKGSTYANPQI